LLLRKNEIPNEQANRSRCSTLAAAYDDLVPRSSGLGMSACLAVRNISYRSFNASERPACDTFCAKNDLRYRSTRPPSFKWSATLYTRRRFSNRGVCLSAEHLTITEI
jgi:hypothetical protein